MADLAIIVKQYGGNAHYENTPIQIYRNFHLQKLKISDTKNSDIFQISAKNIDCGRSLEGEAVLTSTHNLCFRAEITK